MGSGGRRNMDLGGISIVNVTKIIKAAEEITGSPLFQLIKDRLPKMGVELSAAQKLSLDANYVSYVEEIAESRESEQTGRHKEPEAAEEGDAD